MDRNLEDMGFTGELFTWKRGRIREKLDIEISNGDWVTMHLGEVLQHLQYTRSGHRPILLDTNFMEVVMMSCVGPKRFEARWLRESEFCQRVQLAWDMVRNEEGGGVLGLGPHALGLACMR
jgi:hypothetical protein